MQTRPIILFTTPILKYPPVGGPYLRIENSIKALAKISDLHIFCRSSIFSIGGLNALIFYRLYSKSFKLFPYKVINLIKVSINIVSDLLFGKNIFSITFENEKNYKKFLFYANKLKPDIIWLGHGNVSYSLLRYLKKNSQYKVVLDTDSVHSRYYLRGIKFLNGYDRLNYKTMGETKRKEELSTVKLADVVTAVSEIDLNYYKSLVKNPENIFQFSNVINIDYYSQKTTPPINLIKPYIYLAGTFSKSSPMDDAARWMINEIFPIILKDMPNLHFYIVGYNSKKTLADISNNNIHIIGQLPSILPYLINADVVIVPLRFESGTRFKILEAGACRKPVVSTSLGAEGLNVKNSESILIADEPHLFAKNIIAVLKNKQLAEKIGNNLYELVSDKYSVKHLEKEGQKILSYLTLSNLDSPA